MSAVFMSTNKTRSKGQPKAKLSPSVPVNSWSTKLSKSHTGSRLSPTSTRRSRDTAMGKSLNATSLNDSKNAPFSTVESEYIHNLQQQVYFLELECEYLNEERKKLITVPTSVTIEAERMIRRIKTMQGELHVREKQILEKDSTITILQQHKENTLTRLETVEDAYAAEKRELFNEIVLLKNDLEHSKHNATNATSNVQTLTLNLDKAITDLKSAETDKNYLQLQVHEKTEDCNNLRVSHEEKRVESVKLQAELQELEDRFFHTKSREKENADQQFKDEIKKLRYELREKQIQAEQDRALRLKISDDCGTLVKENAALSSQAIETQKQLELEKQFNQDSVYRKQVNIQELVTLKEECKHNAKEIERYKELYEMEQEKYRKLYGKFIVEEEIHTRAKLQNSKLNAELDELGGLKTAGSQENLEYRRENLIMSGHIADLQGKLRTKDDEVDALQKKIFTLQNEYADLKSKFRLQSSFDQIKWEEFEQMADQMKSLSRNLTPLRGSYGSKEREVDFDI